MAHIRAIGTAVPPYTYTQKEAKQLVQQLFSSFDSLERYLSVFDNTGIERRHFCVPTEWFYERHTFAEKNTLYVEQAIALSTQAIAECLQRAHLRAQDVDHLFFISSTGMATPSIDAHLLQRLDFSPHCKRTPIWGLGCAGGAVGLARAFDYVRAYPQAHVLLVAVELCGLTFLPNDRSKGNIIATSLFADGAAAVCIGGAQAKVIPEQLAPRIVDTMSTLHPDTLDVMGWDIQEEGLKVIFSRDIPALVSQIAKPNMAKFLARHALDLADIRHFVLHPGGKKVLEAYEGALHINADQTRIAREVIRDYGNMSSATVLFVLERFLAEGKREEYGLLSALGPGFSSEMLLLQW